MNRQEDRENEVDVEPPVSAEENQRLAEWVALFLRGKWLILGALLAGLGGMAWYTSTLLPVYEATAMVLINPRSGQAANPFGDAMELGPSSKVANELAILKTLSLSEAVAKHLLEKPNVGEAGKDLLSVVQVHDTRGPTGQLASLPTVAARVRSAMEFIPQRESDVVRIVGFSNYAEDAAALANAYAEAYQEQTTLQSRSRTRSAREFLENRLAEQRDSLDKAEKEMRAFMENAGVVSLDQESQQVTTEIAQLEATRNAIDLDIQTAQNKLVSLQNALPAQEAQALASVGQASDAYIKELQQRVGQLEAQRDIVVAQNDPAVLNQPGNRKKIKDLDDQIASLRARLNERSSEFIKLFLAGEGVGPQNDALAYLGGLKQQMLETKFQLETLAARRNALDNTLSQYDARFRQIPRKSIEFARRERDRLSAERLYSLVDERFNQATITEKSEFGYVDLIDRAVVPTRPVSPNWRRNLLLGALIGLAFGVALVAFGNAVDVRTRTPEQMRRRGLTSLAEVAPMDREIKESRKIGRIPKEVRRLDPSVWLVFDPLSMNAEAYRRLRTTLLRMQMASPVKVVLVTSASPSEGKTTTACNLALTLAETNKRVVLLDADIRKPRIHTILGVSNKPGLTDLVAGRASVDQVVQARVVENLDFISSGTTIAKPSQIFSSDEMITLLEVVKARYDFMIIDAPPALVVNDAAVLAGMVDGFLLVVSSGRTRLAAAEKAVGVIRAAKGRLLGLVMNNFDPRREYGRYYGGYRYGHYGSYRGYYSNNGDAEKKRSRATA